LGGASSFLAGGASSFFSFLAGAGVASPFLTGAGAGAATTDAAVFAGLSFLSFLVGVGVHDGADAFRACR